MNHTRVSRSRAAPGVALPPRSLARRRAWAALVFMGFMASCDSPTESTSVAIGHVDRPAVVRGIYVNAQAAGSPAQLAALLDVAERSDVNAFVIDVKERGEVSYATEVPMAGVIGAERAYIADLPGLLQTLRDRGVYPIARISCFRDPVLGEAIPEWAIRTMDGSAWLDPESNRPWADPYRSEVWDYNIALAREALSIGFAEVQWDYVRFPDVSDDVRATFDFPTSAGRSAGEVIEEFIATSRVELADLDAAITADVFGRVISEVGPSVIGQEWDRLVRVTDVLLPIVYPALYGTGSFGITDPNSDPYRLVRSAMDSAVVRLARTPGASATVRPWLQAYSWAGTVYGTAEIQDQIRAVEDAGLEEWIFWNPDSRYPADAF